jgi:uncharacterized caspase-like protein/WD40 repeat protein
MALDINGKNLEFCSTRIGLLFNLLFCDMYHILIERTLFVRFKRYLETTLRGFIMNSRTVVRIIVALLCAVGAASAQQAVYVEQQQSMELFAAPISCNAFSAKANMFCFVGSNGSIKLIDATTFKERVAVPLADLKIVAAAFSKSGKYLALGALDGKLTVVNTASGAVLSASSFHSGSIISLAYQEDGWVFSAGLDGKISISEATSGDETAKFPEQQEVVSEIALDPAGKNLAVGASAGNVSLYSYAQQQLLQTFADAKEKIGVLSYTADGKLLIAGTASGSLYVWDMQKNLLKAKWNDQKSRICSFTVDSKNRWLVTGAADSTIRFYDLEKQLALNCIKEDCVPTTVTFVTDEALIVATSKKTLEQWKVSTTPPDTSNPSLVIMQPLNTTDQTPSNYYGDEPVISGYAYDDSGIKELTMNGVPVKFESFVPPDSLKIPASMKAVKFSTTLKLDSAGLNNVQMALTDLYKHTVKSTCYIQKLTKDQALEIMTPSNNAETDLISVPIHFRAWFDIASFSVSANMTDIISGQEPCLSAKNDINETVPLLVGYNQIQLTVLDKTGNQYVKTLGVTRRVNTSYSNPSFAAGSPKVRSASSGPQRWAVVVGVSEYQNPGIPSLKYADKDAEALADFLRKPEGGGYDSDHLRVLLNKDATLANVKEALISFLAQAIDMDLVLIYFAGHGAPEPARPQNVYLLTTDSDPNALGTTAFPMWDIQTVLARYINAKRVVVFTDACHSGNIVNANFATRGLAAAENNLVNQYLSDLSKTKEGIVVFTASAAGEVSAEFPEYEHGVFTYYMLQGLEGKADLNNDYTVTINELMQYVEEQVKRKTRGAQNPTRSQTDYDKEMTISILPH